MWKTWPLRALGCVRAFVVPRAVLQRDREDVHHRVVERLTAGERIELLRIVRAGADHDVGVVAGVQHDRRDLVQVADALAHPLGIGHGDEVITAANQAFGMSSGKPMGMPATLGVSMNGCPGSSNPGSVQAMQVKPPRMHEPTPYHGRVLQSACACVPLQPRFSIRQPRSEAFCALALNS